MKEYVRPEHITEALANLPQLVLEVTDSCNLKCKYCAYGDLYSNHDKRHDKKMNFGMARCLIDYLYPFWTSRYNTSSHQTLYISFYGGEPLLNIPLIRDVVKYIEGLEIPHRDVRFSMTTNAMLLDQHMDYLVEKNFSLLISLDGNEENNSYRVNHFGKPSFDRVKSNIDLLKEKYPDFFQHNVEFNSVFHNRSTVDEVFSFISDNYNKIPNISDLNNVGVRDEKKAEFNYMFKSSNESLNNSDNQNDIREKLSIRNPEYRSLTLFLKKYSGFAFEDYTDLLFKKQTAFVPTGTCFPFTRKLYLSVNGKILPCERIGQQFYLGEITESRVILDPVSIAQMYNSQFAKMEKTCKSCHNKNSCSQCMYNLDKMNDQPHCNNYMDKEKFQSFCAHNISLIRQIPTLYKTIMTEVFSS